MKLLSLTTVWLKKYFCFCALAQITALRDISLKYSLLLHGWRVTTWCRFGLDFQVMGKNRHLWLSLTDENDSLLSWLRQSPDNTKNFRNVAATNFLKPWNVIKKVVGTFQERCKNAEMSAFCCRKYVADTCSKQTVNV